MLIIIATYIHVVRIGYTLHKTGPDLGGGGGPQASHQQGASHQTPQFFCLMIDVSLIILIEDFEINENWLNTGRVEYQPIMAQTFKIY